MSPLSLVVSKEKLGSPESRLGQVNLGLSRSARLAAQTRRAAQACVCSHGAVLCLLPKARLTQGLKSSLLHCRQILYCLSYQGNPLRSVVSCNLQFSSNLNFNPERRQRWERFLFLVNMSRGLI